MPFTSFAFPILPNKLKLAQQVFAERRAKMIHEKFVCEERAFWRSIGVSHWHCWLQEFRDKHLLIHFCDGLTTEQLFRKYKELIAAGHPRAQRVHEFYQNVVGCDLNDPDQIPRTDVVADVNPLPPAEQAGVKDTFLFAYAFTIFEDQVEPHRQFCLEAAKDLSFVRETAHKLGVAHLRKVIQSDQHGNYIIYLQDMLPRPERERADIARSLRQQPSFSKFSEPFRLHTGISFESARPRVQVLFEGTSG